jgi:hypothetical protein
MESIQKVPMAQVSHLLNAIEAQGLRWMPVEKLCRFDGANSFTKAQGEN